MVNVNDIFTREEFSNTVWRMTGENYFPDILNESRSYREATPGYKTIFLSHSHLDASYVLKTRKFFENLGIKIYVDWADEYMPKQTCGDTATKIKEKIRGNNFFVFLATDNSIISRWCNWEVGYGDSYKFSEYKEENRILILPLASNRRDWEGNEYLQLYPYVIHRKKVYPYSTEEFYVHNPDGSEVTLKNWLNR